MTPHLASAWSVRAAAGEPVAVVRVRNLQTVTRAASDAWGRPDKPQPLLISVEVSFAQPFAAAAAVDRLGPDTVHYGTLSKAVLARLEASASSTSIKTLRGLLDDVWFGLTGQTVSGVQLGSPACLLAPALAAGRIRFLAVTLTLPKASLLGSAVSVTACATFSGKPSLPTWLHHGCARALS